MAQAQTDNLTGQAADAQRDKPARSGSGVLSGNFKYYIHDSITELRFQILGEIGETEIRELNGCWQTAKGTLGLRRLLLDLRGVRSVDETAKQWLAAMAQERACYLPEAFLRDALANKPNKHDEQAAVRLSLLGRVLGLLRGVRVAPAE
jgi:hypothetical protein